MSEDLDLRTGLRELSTLLLSEETLDTTLRQVAEVAIRCVAGGTAASVALVKSGCPVTAYASDERAAAVEERQHELREGPLLEALKTGEPATAAAAGDAATAWPEVVDYAAACGIKAILAVPLLVKTEVAGVLTVYSETPDSFGETEVASASLLAEHAAVAVTNARTHDECASRIEQLQVALESRIAIEQAKGILMERHRLSPDAAFDRLRESSQHTNRKLRDVVADVLAPFSGG